ncbi:MAG: tRNA dihydrouridine(20/20a) synthase DusA [Pseudomonadota bacterium]|nr:tRNA dihydrouridine(20/20a) synthase DusA [Pseudomonadota bacterium]
MSRHRVCVAPMMARTDRHERYFLRLISRHTFLYTEMVTAAAVMHGDRDRVFAFNKFEQPVALQLGGSDPTELAEASAKGEGEGYNEINLNVGCPSSRVQSAKFGAYLMIQPDLVAECVKAMLSAVSVPVTVKTRIGVDERDSYADLYRFVSIVAEAGCETFFVHARKALLSGLSPKQNREVPPLKYERVYRLKKDFPELEIIINGGILDLCSAKRHLEFVDGVMIGRAAYQDPYLLSQVDRLFFLDAAAIPSRKDLVEAYKPYIETCLDNGVRLSSISRHMMGLYRGQPRGKAWRKYLSDFSRMPGSDVSVIDDALQKMSS